jgi:hypothetical protein
MSAETASVPEAGRNALQFIDIQWLSAYGIRAENALEYFYTSPFFDTKSNNQTVRIQGVDVSRRDGILQDMTGKEYVLDGLNTDEPNLYVIREQVRHSSRPGDVSLVSVFYILDGVIYQSPDFLDLLNSRLGKVSNYLTRGFSNLRDGVTWEFDGGDGREDTENPASKSAGFRLWKANADEDNKAAAAGAKDGISHKPIVAAAAAAAKYTRIIREFPSFQSVLLDAHAVSFQE